MKCNPWTLAVISVGLTNLPAVSMADEKPASSVMTAVSATTLSGYADTSAQWNFGTGNQYVPNYGLNSPKNADGFNFNVVRLTLERPVDSKESGGWAAGYRVDLLAGPYANKAFGLGTQSGGTSSDFGVKQAYVALHAPLGPNGLDLKIGVWDTLMGYEVFDTIGNPNFTRSYGWSVEPTTHTGIQLGYQCCDYFSVAAAVVNSFGPTINERSFYNTAESYKSYMGSFTFTAPTNMGFFGGSTLTACIMNGYNSASPAFGGMPADQTSYYIGGTFNTPWSKLKVGACYDYVGVSQQRLTADTSGYVNVVGGYLLLQATEKLAINTRGEYGSSSSVGVPGTGAFGGVSLAGSNPAHRVAEITTTVQYDLWKNVVSRIEFRWDHAADGSHPYGGDLGDPGNTLKANNFILLANVAYKF